MVLACRRCLSSHRLASVAPLARSQSHVLLVAAKSSVVQRWSHSDLPVHTAVGLVNHRLGRLDIAVERHLGFSKLAWDN